MNNTNQELNELSTKGPAGNTNKKIITLAAIIVIFISIVVGTAVYVWQQKEIRIVKEQAQQQLMAIKAQTPTPQTISDEEQIKVILAKEFGVPVTDITHINVETNDGKFAQGQAEIGTGLSSGAVFFVTKQNGNWLFVSAGNGIPECANFDKYQFPRNMYGACSEEDGELRDNINLGTPNVAPKGWKVYVNGKERLSFSYPSSWTMEENLADEKIVALADKTGRLAVSNGIGDYDFSVTKCANINTECATDGWWTGKRQYKNIADLLTDKMSVRQPSQTMPNVTIDGLPGFGVIRGGAGNNFEIMFERNGEVFLLDFASSDGNAITSEYKQIIASFKFL